MRALAFLSIALGVGLALAPLASCDTGGEPPAKPDTGLPDSPVTDVTVDMRPATDTQMDTVIGEGPEPDSGCGTPGNACCTGDVAPCSDGGTCKDKFCDCGRNGQRCCGSPGTCHSSSAVCDSHNYCTPCGGPGDTCCALNACAGGGCCVGGICSPEGTKCAGTDGGVCMTGGCGSCGSAGQPCCTSGCTAPQTVCQGAITPVDAGEGGGGGGGSSGECAGCGGPGQPCCAGSSCESSLMCTTGICVCVTSTCSDAGD